MRRRGWALRRYAATAALLLVLGIAWVPVARAAGSPGGVLTRSYPLGTQTLQTGRARTSTSAAASPPSSTSTGTSAPASGSTGASGDWLPIAVAVIGVLVLALLARLEYRRTRRGVPDDQAETARVPPPRPETARVPPPRPETARVPPPQAEEARPRRDEDDDLHEAEDVAPASVGQPPQLAPASVGQPPQPELSPDFEDASDDVPDRGEDEYQLGITLYEQGNLEAAEAAWRLAVEHQHARAAIRLGIVLEHRGDLDGAHMAYRLAKRWAATAETRGRPTARDRGLR